jgi:hypothetical protein
MQEAPLFDDGCQTTHWWSWLSTYRGGGCAASQELQSGANELEVCLPRLSKVLQRAEKRVLEMSVMRQRDDMRLKELGVPFDWSLLITLKRCVSNMAGSVLVRACEQVESRSVESRSAAEGEGSSSKKEQEELSATPLVEGTVELAYKAYQVAGGFASDTMQHLLRLKSLIHRAPDSGSESGG